MLFSRFYIESISFLKDKTTVELFFLNAKSCVHKVRALFAADSSGARLAGSNGRAFVFMFKWRKKDIIFFFFFFFTFLILCYVSHRHAILYVTFFFLLNFLFCVGV